MKYPLVRDTIDNEDIDELIEWLKTYPRLTKGPLTKEFENEWAKWLGVKHAVFVNSGSSANLLMLYALMLNGILEPGDSVIVPAISWATDLAPVIQLGLDPVLCDCNMANLSIDTDHFERLCEVFEPKAVMLVSVLGLIPDMDELIQICKKHNVTLLEDVCESLGSMCEGRKLGTFGEMSSFSLYFGHHISTIEGGMICTNNDTYADILYSIRNHGWDRDWDDRTKQEWRNSYDIDEFDALYTFYYPGFNVRATDLQAKLGLRQLSKLDEVCRIREENFRTYLEEMHKLNVWYPDYAYLGYVSNFCFPVIHEKRDEIVKALRAGGVEVRPLICGSMGTQPMYVDRFGPVNVPNADHVSQNGMYVPNNQSMNADDVRYITNIIKSVIEKE